MDPGQILWIYIKKNIIEEKGVCKIFLIFKRKTIFIYLCFLFAYFTGSFFVID